MKTQVLILSLFLIGGHVWAAERTATFAVSDMTCALCPEIVEMAMGQVRGVKSVKADFDTGSTIAVFDDTQTTVEQLAQASADAGYPAQLKGLK